MTCFLQYTHRGEVRNFVNMSCVSNISHYIDPPTSKEVISIENGNRYFFRISEAEAGGVVALAALYDTLLTAVTLAPENQTRVIDINKHIKLAISNT